MTKNCLICKNEFTPSSSNVKKGGGKFCSRKCMGIFYKTSRLGEGNPLWKGDNVKYGSLHDWVKWHLIKPQTCRDCNLPKPLDLANISGEYKRDLSDWEWLCRSCHMEKDGRLKLLIENSANKRHKTNDKTI